MRPTSQRGQVYPLFAMMLVVLLGVSALSVDMGYYRYQQRNQQIATDAAAIAGAAEYERSDHSVTDMQDAVSADAKTNLGTPSPAPIVTADPGYTSAYTGGNTAVEVKISESYPKIFGAIWGAGRRSIQTRAVAALLSSAGACITTLGSSPQSSIHSTTGTNCTIVTNGCPKVTGTLDVQGFTYSTSGCSTVPAKDFTDGKPQLALPPQNPCQTIPDCANLATYSPPPSASCTGKIDATKGVSLIGNCYNNVGKVNGCKGNGSTFKLNSGLYVFEGSGVDFQGCSVTGSNVTIYLAGTATFTIGGSAFTLSAPPSGTNYTAYSSGQGGILFYGTSSSNGVSVANGTTITSDGLWYFPNSSLTLDGANGSTFTGGIIVNSYTDNGNTRFIDPASNTGGGQQVIPTLVE